MKPAQLEIYRQRLLAMRQELQQMDEDSAEARGTVTLDQQSVRRLSRMDAMQGQQMALETERRRKRQLLEIEAALRRINADEYGECLECGEEIASGRLDINPAVTCCIGCSD